MRSISPLILLPVVNRSLEIGGVQIGEVQKTLSAVAEWVTVNFTLKVCTSRIFNFSTGGVGGRTGSISYMFPKLPYCQ